MTARQRDIGCSLDTDTLERRRTELRQGLLSRVVEIRPIDVLTGDGLALALRAGNDSRRELEELVEFESRCCGFASYAIRLEPERSLLWLEIVGPPGTRALFERLAERPDRIDDAERVDRSARAGLAGVAAAGSAGLALVLCASPALPVLLGGFGLGTSLSDIVGWIDSVAPPLLGAGLLLAAWALFSPRRRKAARS